MAVRVRGVVASILLIAFVFMSIGALLPQKTIGHQNREKLFSFVGWANTAHPSIPPVPAYMPMVMGSDFRLLIGVMSPSWSSARRQIIRNAYHHFSSNLPVDVVFVQANTASINEKNSDRVMGMNQVAMTWENDTFHDILHLDCTENLVEGKTYEYLRKVGSEWSTRYTHVMKTDDDSFVNIPGTSIACNANEPSCKSCTNTENNADSIGVRRGKTVAGQQKCGDLDTFSVWIS